MGSCVSALSSVGGDRSRRERTFQVWNLDEQGAEVSPGKIEVNANDLVLYQRGRPPVRWPLRGLRRYGFDAHLFSFESGRRCPTGSGIYAFKCHRAEALFNALQECIQNSGAASAMTTTISSSATATDQQQSVPSSGVVPLTSQRNDIIFPPPISNGPTVDSSGYLEPISLGPLRPPTTTQSNTAAITTATVTAQNLPQHVQHSYVNSCAQCGQPHPPPCVDINTNYAKLDDLLRQEAVVKQRDSNHFYVNVNPMPLSQQHQQPPPSQTHSYANLSCPASPERAVPPSAAASSSAAAAAGLVNNGGLADEVNYVVLDLDHQSDSSTSAVSPVATAAPVVGTTAVAPGGATVALAPPGSQPTSPIRTPEGYATIDFDRTAALSNSANPSAHHHDDSVRKTRHNSNAVPVLC
ncbi:fibroblast growth factor receptor substrate 3-like [Dermacentor albipictus]|uniref:fibroblast growth factor receptor substrate 3-like n=1 Tax=Dermacentor albipictus TaxID=60249 RepID=UPI0038FC3A34